MKRVLLELGGKGAALVLDDADVNAAVTAIGSVWTFHSGQICTAPTRAIVHRSKYDELVERLAGFAGNVKVGDPLDDDTIVGPVISAAQRDRIESYVAAGSDEGAEIVVDGRRPGHMERGYYVAPTLLAGCKPDMKPVQGGDLRAGGRGAAVRRRRGGRRHRQQHRLRSLRLRDDERHRARVPPRRSPAIRQRRHQHRAAQHGDAVRRFQDERHRPRRRRLRPLRVHRDAVGGVAAQ